MTAAVIATATAGFCGTTLKNYVDWIAQAIAMLMETQAQQLIHVIARLDFYGIQFKICVDWIVQVMPMLMEMKVQLLTNVHA